MLTDTEASLLAIWKRWPHDDQRDRRLNAYVTHGLSETRAVQVVNRLLTSQVAWEHDPVTVARLRRLRDSRVRRHAWATS